ncbi:hypothetical protein DMH04_10665 [Kibdelosporangium aridum]|uniref:DUF2946 domain-containing protein n=1 Tax=Kibdelosporangium aridum TaxID=2030 RepID=A0A428ZHC0_KIBAR|nr:DUF6153 family protein [Kibdelosporangium aridum]RSM87479.1 hypothetical protein DMH04_10665 [Kibdelosporangium aridum]
MKLSVRTAGPRWLLLCLLLLGVVSMHHFAPTEAHDQHVTAASHAMTDAPAPDPMHEPDGPIPSPVHDLLHLCMAVLCAIAGFVLIGLLLARRRPVDTPLLRLTRRVQRVERPPRSSGRNLLSSVCVLRL